MEIRKCRKAETEVSELRVGVQCVLCYCLCHAPLHQHTHTHMASPFIEVLDPSSQSKSPYPPESGKFANVMMLKSVSKYSSALFIFI